MAVRELKVKKIFKLPFIVNIILLTLGYYLFMQEFMYYLNSSSKILFNIVFHFLFGMTLWSMARVTLTDPGRIPSFYA